MDAATPAPGSGATSIIGGEVELEVSTDVPLTVGEVAARVLYPSVSADLTGPAFMAAQAEKEKGGAEAHAVDLPVVDASHEGVRWTEPGAANINDYGNVMSPPTGQTFTEPGEVALAKLALVNAGVGITLAGKFFGMFLQTARSGPAKLTDVQGMEALKTQFGDKTDATVEDARSFYRQILAKWKGAERFLNESGLGNDPRMIALMAKAYRRKK